MLTTDVNGWLTRNLSVRLLNISRSGCLLESTNGLGAGHIGTLRLEIDGTVYTDAVRVTRAGRVPGAGERHHVAVEFLVLGAPAPQSLRVYAATLSAAAGGSQALQFE